MKIVPKLLTMAAAIVLALPSLHAQTTTYNIGASNCGVASYSLLDCYNMPLTINGQTTTAWIDASFIGSEEDFFVMHNGGGDCIVSNVQVLSSISYKGQSYPTEFTANLTGTDGTTSSGTMDIKVGYTVGKVSRWNTGLIASTAGGTVNITN
jgi:hypothetical protein